MNNKKRSNQFGFTLVEVMVAAGLIGVLSVAVTGIISNINKTSKRATQIFNIQQERERLSRLLSDPISCFQTLQNLDLGSNSGSPKQYWDVVTVPDINDKDGNVVYAIGDEIGEGADTITLNNIRVRRPRDGATDNPTNPAVDEYTVGVQNYSKFEVVVEAFYKKGRATTTAAQVAQNTVGQAVSRALIRAQVVVFRGGGNDGQVSSCYGDADQYLTNACTALNGTIDVDSKCKDLSIGTLQTTPTTNNTNALTVGDSNSATIVNTTASNAPLKIRLGSATTYMSLDDDTIQTRTNTLNLNPYGHNLLIGNTATTANIRSTVNGTLNISATTNITGTTNFNNTGTNVNFNSSTYFNRPMFLANGMYFRFLGSSYIDFASDRRYKHEINELEDVLEKFDSIRGVEFVWNSNNRRDIGYIAQEIETVFPEVVSTDKDGMKSVQYTKMPAINTAAIKELKKENDELKFRLNLVMKALCNSDDADKYEDLCLMPVAPLE